MVFLQYFIYGHQTFSVGWGYNKMLLTNKGIRTVRFKDGSEISFTFPEDRWGNVFWSVAPELMTWLLTFDCGVSPFNLFCFQTVLIQLKTSGFTPFCIQSGSHANVWCLLQYLYACTTSHRLHTCRDSNRTSMH